MLFLIKDQSHWLMRGTNQIDSYRRFLKPLVLKMWRSGECELPVLCCTFLHLIQSVLCEERCDVVAIEMHDCKYPWRKNILSISMTFMDPEGMINLLKLEVEFLSWVWVRSLAYLLTGCIFAHCLCCAKNSGKIGIQLVNKSAVLTSWSRDYLLNSCTPKLPLKRETQTRNWTLQNPLHK